MEDTELDLLLLIVGCWLLVVGCWLFVVGCLLFVVKENPGSWRAQKSEVKAFIKQWDIGGMCEEISFTPKFDHDFSELNCRPEIWRNKLEIFRERNARPSKLAIMKLQIIVDVRTL